MVCLNHPDREAAAVCAACGKPLCSECMLDIDGAVYCSEVCHQKGVASRDRSAAVIATSAKVDHKSRVRFWIIFIIVILLLGGGGYYYYKLHHQRVEKKLTNLAKRVSSGIKEEAEEAVDAGKGAMPQKSRYKREREALVNEK